MPGRNREENDIGHLGGTFRAANLLLQGALDGAARDHHRFFFNHDVELLARYRIPPGDGSKNLQGEMPPCCITAELAALLFDGCLCLIQHLRR